MSAPEASSAPRKRWPVVVGALVVVCVVVGLVITRDNRHLQPEIGEMEDIAGVALEDPTYVPSSTLTRAHTWWTYWTGPLPNQMSMRSRGDTWVYAFEAAPSYEPPAASPLMCTRRDASVRCEGTASGGWIYTLQFKPETGLGIFSAQVVPE